MYIEASTFCESIAFYNCLDYYCVVTIDKSIIIWQLTRDDTNYGVPKNSLVGHSDIVSDVAISSDGMSALSGSWDSTLRMWDLSK